MNLLRKNDLFLCQVTLVCQVLVIEHGDKMVTMLAITGMANFSFSQFENVLKITLRVQCLLSLDSCKIKYYCVTVSVSVSQKGTNTDLALTRS